MGDSPTLFPLVDFSVRPMNLLGQVILERERFNVAFPVGVPPRLHCLAQIYQREGTNDRVMS